MSLLSTLRNILQPTKADAELAMHALELVGLADKSAARSDELSGGQQQRLAEARVLMQSPDVILADEPTASLDPELAETMTSLLAGLARDGRKTLIMAVHKVDLALRHFPYLRARSVYSTEHGAKVRTLRFSALKPFISNSRKLVGLMSALSLVVASFALAGFSPQTLIQAGIATRLTDFVRRMLPPDFTWAFVGSLGTALLQTIAISFMGTLIGIILAMVLAVPATSTLVFVRGDSPGRHRTLERVLRWLLFWSTRLVLNILRSIPELVWVLICIRAVGIGTFAGTIAPGLHTSGVLGKLYAETMGEVPFRPVEALRSLGARPVQLLLWAMWPQARPLLSSYTVLRWEMNLRASTILGLVGGGGLGQAIYNSVQLGFYPRLSTLILLTYALVLTNDWIGERLRLKVA